MSCSAIASAAFLLLATSAPAAVSPEPAPPAAASIQEPLFADIVARAGKLKQEVDGFRGKAGPAPKAFSEAVAELAALDMRAHLVLKARGVDGDLKCILKGISEDLPLKLQALTAAGTPAARDAAALDLSYLLNDNVEVITAPPAPPV